MANVKAKSEQIARKAASKNQTSNEPDKKRVVQSRTFSSMPKEERLKFIMHDLRAALYVLELVMADKDVQEKLLAAIAIDEAKARKIMEEKAKVNAQ